MPAVFTVTNTADSGAGSLRQAINAANGVPGADSINFDTSGAFSGFARIRLATGQMAITDDLTITGTGLANLTIDASGAVASSTNRVFMVDGPGNINVGISGMTLTGGHAVGAGGAVQVSNEVLSLSNVALTNNVSTIGGGGALAAIGVATITMDSSTLSGNLFSGSAFGGGAIFAAPNSSLTILNSTISGNVSWHHGGAVFASGAGVTVRNSSINGNAAIVGGGGGGAFYFTGMPSTLTFVNSTLTSNTGKDGGAFRLNGCSTQLQLIGCTVVSNTCTTGNAGGINRFGGAINNTILLDSTIVAGNVDLSTVTLRPDIENNNTALSYRNSAIGSTVGFSAPSIDLGGNLAFGATLNLGTLAFNGGPTLTMAPLPGSALIDAGFTTSNSTTDQRGQPRQIGAKVDIGAVEIDTNKPQATASLSNVTTAGGSVYTLTMVYTDNTNVSLASINSSDVRVIGPNLNVLATFSAASSGVDATPITATYTFTPPGGTWDAGDNGTYTVSVEANQVSDDGGSPAFVVAGPAGTLSVAIPPTLKVMNTNDSGAGSLRQAISDANATPGADTITFDTAGAFSGNATIKSGGQMRITDSLTITGTGASNLTVANLASPSSAARLFLIDGAGTISVTLSGMTVSGGNATSAGGAIAVNDENLSLSSVTFTNNASTAGGGALAMTGAATVSVAASTFSGNTSSGSGGGGGAILAVGGSSLFVTNSTISGNVTGNNGGGVFAQGGVTVNNSAILNNTALLNTGAGGGFYFNGTPGVLLLNNATISGNFAKDGGAIRLNAVSTPLQIFSSTIIANTVTTGNGGGINRSGGTAPNNTMTIESTILSANIDASTATFAPDAQNNGSTFTFNQSAIGSTLGFTATTVNNGSSIGAALNVGPLGYNGGPTVTFPLLPISALINAGSTTTPLSTDQRGAPRLVGSNVDVGAYEYDVNEPQATGTFSNVTAFGASSHSVVVTYTDDVSILFSSLDSSDVRVTGPNGFNVLATLSATSSGVDATPMTATYTFTPPGGTWDVADVGAFTISVEPSQVSDTGGSPAFVVSGPRGSFNVGVATTYTVTNTNDSGAGSLRQAILDSNANFAADTIIFDTAGAFSGAARIILTSGQMVISDNLTITGTGASSLTISNATIASINSRIFGIDGPGTLSVSLSGMTLTNGNVASLGGAIAITDESVTLTNMRLVGNTSSALGGGAVGLAFAGATLNVVNSTITGNLSSATGGAVGGGAITSVLGSTVTITGSTISANTTFNHAGAIFSLGGLTIESSTLTGNSATANGGGGGGIYTSGAPAILLFRNSTFTNHVGKDGGAFRLTNCSTQLQIYNCTITGNTASVNGGGVNRAGSTGTIYIEGSIVSGNVDTTGGTSPDLENGGTSIAFINGAVGTTVGLTGATIDLTGSSIGQALNLGALGFNGGLTMTQAAISPSPFVIDYYGTSTVTTDQRGQPRPVGASFDVGAVEIDYNAPQLFTVSAVNVTLGGGTSYTVSLTYVDDVAILRSSLDNSDVRITGPGGFNVLATLVAPTSPDFDNVSIAADYTFTPPGGSWDYADIGTYTVSVESTQVSDTGGTPAYVVAGTAAQFSVSVPNLFTVTNANDAGVGSLRQAILDANANIGADTINFDTGFFATPQVIQVLLGQMVVTDSVTINGPGAANLVTLNNLAGNSTTSRLFNINIPGALAPVAISNLTFNGGNASSAGGAITIADDAVTITNCVFTNNTASVGGGGAIELSGTASVSIDSCTFNSNYSSPTSIGGGAIHQVLNSNLLIDRSTFSNNTSNFHGGAIFTTGGGLTVRNSTFSGNTANNGASGGGGGVFYMTGTPGVLLFENTTITGNIGRDGGAFRLNNCNTPLQLFNSTIVGNSAFINGGGINRFGGTSTILLENTILANNFTVGNAPEVENNNTTFSMKNSALGTVNGLSPGFTTDLGGNLIGAILLLGPLSNNGGPTLTMLPAQGSPLRDAGAPSALGVDQRLNSRTQGAAPDIGAVESDGTEPVAIGTLPNIVTGGGATATFTVTYYDDSGIDISKFANTNVTVRGFDGYDVAASFVSAAPGTGAKTEVVTYSIPAPGGTWDQFDDNTYTVTLNPQQIRDNSLNFIPGATLGTFLVQVGTTYTVTTTADSGVGSLRQAILNANASLGIDTVVFDTAGAFSGNATITLTGGEMAITDHLTITGTGASKLLVNSTKAASTTSRIFNISGAGQLLVNISGATLQGANNTANGGAVIIANETVSFTDVTFNKNATSVGGGAGIYVTDHSLVTVKNSTFTANTVTGTAVGAAIRVSNNTILIVDNCSISGNTAAANAGGIYASAASVTILNSGITNNSVTGGVGGGMTLNNFVRFGSTPTVRNSTISGNVASQSGGGIELTSSFAGTLLIQNSTVFNNTANGVAANQGGGGIHNGDLTSPYDGKISIESTILSGNKQGGVPATVAPDVFTKGSVDYKTSALGSSTGITTLNDLGGNLGLGANLFLSTLSNYGGISLTHLPGGISPVRDIGSNPAGLTTDQRGVGFPRVLDGVIDIGAVESIGGIPSASTSLSNIISSGGTIYTFTVTYVDNSKIKVSTIDSSDIRITGPGGFDVLATLSGKSSGVNTTPVTATYTFTPPDNAVVDTWDDLDNGSYTVTMEPNQVQDEGVDFVPAGTLGTFSVGIPRIYVVTTTANTGAGSLRQVLLDANAFASIGDTITFDTTTFATTQTITLSTGEIPISDGVTIVGPGAGVVVNANKASRIFNINGTGTLNVAISNMTLTGGSVAGAGGAILIDDESVTLTNMTITANTSSVTGGGGINVNANGSLTILNSTISNNLGSFTAGGGIRALSGTFVSLKNSTVSGNTASSGGGGGIFVLAGTTAITGGSLVIRESTVSGNSASGDGGGVYFNGTVGAGGFKILNSTIANNKNSTNGGGIRIRTMDGTLLIQNSTIVGNTTTGNGGGIDHFHPDTFPGAATSLISIESSVFANYSPVSGKEDIANDNNVSIQPVQGKNNLFKSFSGGGFNYTDNGGTIFSTDPLLGTLANNGGPTMTMLPLFGSPLLHVGSNPAGLTFDQRGTTRTIGAGTDIGSVELDTNIPTATVSPLTDITVAGGTSYDLVVTYNDDVAIKYSTLDNLDIRIKGPAGFNVLATFVMADDTIDGTPRVATYTFTPPGGAWDGNDAGVYSVIMEPSQVTDTGSTAVATSTLGTFAVTLAGNFVVDEVSDVVDGNESKGKVSFREALNRANSVTGTADTISFDTTVFTTGAKVTLTGGAYVSTDQLTVMGPGATNLTFDANFTGRIFTVPDSQTLTLSGMTLTGGNAATGSAIQLGASTVAISGVTITGNSNSAAVYLNNVLSTFSADSSTFSNNTSTTGGGAIRVNPNGGNVTLLNSTLSGNTSSGAGGAIYFNFGGSLIIESSTLSGNRGTTGAAIALWNATASVTNSTLTGNTATGNGGAIALQSTTANITLNNSTVAGNSATSGGGISRVTGAGTITLNSTIVATNKIATAGTDIFSADTTTIGGDFNLIGVADGSNIDISAQANTLSGAASAPLDPLLAPLGNFGGPTLVMPLNSGSPALDKGDAGTVSFDQRGTGFPRVVNGQADVGAVEGVNVIPSVKLTAAPNITVTGGTTYAFTVVYSDETGIDTATIDTSDVTVTGPGVGSPFTPISFSKSGSGTSVTVTYTINAPGGSFDPTDNGPYTITMNNSQVFDTDGPNAVVGGSLGTFIVGIGTTYVVNATNDESIDGDGKTSLREAILKSNASFGALDTINFDGTVFAGAQTITLTLGEIAINDGVMINGPGANKVTVDANKLSRIFTINGAGQMSVTISGMTLINGQVAGGGGAMNIDNEIVTISNCVISNNSVTTTGGGAINLAANGSLTLNNCTLNSNTSSVTGGTIRAAAAGSTIVIQSSSITNSSASGAGAGGGGGIFASAGTTLVTGISLQILNSTISGNTSNGEGAGLYFVGAVGTNGLLIQNSTFSANTANNNGGAIRVRNMNGQLYVQNSTIVNNRAAFNGGGIDHFHDSTVPYAANSLIYVQSSVFNNTSGILGGEDVRNDNNAGIQPVQSSNSLFKSTTGTGFNCTDLGGTTFGVDPQLGALANNGGPTQTHMPLAGSPLIDKGANPATLTTDQRGPGFVREDPTGKTDVGAVEYRIPATVTNVQFGDGTIQRSMVKSITVTFSENVILPANPADAFTLFRSGTGGTTGNVTLAANQVGNVVTLTFSGSFAPIGKSLIDGFYDLTIDGSKVFGQGGQLDGDGNASPGGNYAVVGDTTNKFFRLYGDGDGNAIVNQADFIAFRNAFNLGPSGTWDYEEDGNVTQSDFIQFRNRFNLTP